MVETPHKQRRREMEIKCEMCGNAARFIVNNAVAFCEDCFSPDDPTVRQLEAEGLTYEELSDDSNESE